MFTMIFFIIIFLIISGFSFPPPRVTNIADCLKYCVDTKASFENFFQRRKGNCLAKRACRLGGHLGESSRARCHDQYKFNIEDMNRKFKICLRACRASHPH